MTARNTPRRHCTLCVYDFRVHQFHRAGPDIIHLAGPCHLVGSFQRLGDTLSLGHLPDDSVQPLLRLLINIGNVAVQPAAEQQAGIAGLAVFPDVPQVSLTPYATGCSFSEGAVRQGK